ncbi:MAG: element excision factor XisI family protein [Blastocatellia bacterium]
MKSEPAIDEVRDNYLWVKVGWSGKRRIDGTTFSARIRDGKWRCCTNEYCRYGSGSLVSFS